MATIQTSVVLTPEALRLKNDKLSAFGMKTIFSAGMVWFNGLDTGDQLKLMALAKVNKPLKPLIVKIIEGERDLTGAVPSVPLADGMARVSLDVPVDMKDPLLAFVETLVRQKLKVPKSDEPRKRRIETASG